jgi:hypothetical protein
MTACVHLFVQNPLSSFFEGCGEVCQVAQMRFFQAEANNILVWADMLTHHGLFALAKVMVASGTVGTLFLWGRGRFLLGLLRYPSGEHSVRWRVEIWPFQWRLAVCWLCTYLTMQIFTPMLFCYRNAVEAGQMGMSISVIGYVYAIVLAWMTTKAPPFGQFVARGEFADLDNLFFRTLRQATLLLFLFVGASMLAVIALQNWSPALAARLVSPHVFSLLLLGTVSSVLIQCMAIYLRSFKREPFLWQSLAVALLTMLSSYLLGKRMGTPGISLSYFACTGVVGLLSATLIFQSWRNRSTKFQIQALPFVGNER